MTTANPLVLVILDGFGDSPPSPHNAITTAKTPTLDYLKAHYLYTTLSGSGDAVGLPHDQMGNSEVGHLNLGAGRIVPQEFTRITKAIDDNTFFQNSVLIEVMKETRKNQKALHLIGLVSSGGVHSHVNHIIAAIRLAVQEGINKLYLHAFLDGRDTPPKSAEAELTIIENTFQALGHGKIATLCGRYYAMDRDQRWDRIEEAYNLLTENKGLVFNSALSAIQAAYARGETDEFVSPSVIYPAAIQDGDSVIFMNFRADRARELTQSFVAREFTGFKRNKKPSLCAFVSLTQYDIDFDCAVAFKPFNLSNSFGEYIASQGLKQLRIAETEKYAHVTFFFNGGIEKAFLNEERILIPSPKVKTYDLQPEMSAELLTETLSSAILSQQYHVIICNYANADMVGHTGNFNATVKAIETLDACLAKIQSALEKVGGEMLITADHGNADCMYDEKTKQQHTAHTTNPVPFIYIGRKASITKHDGVLADIAPTMLYLMGLPIPKEMTGTSLLKLDEQTP